MNLYTAPTITVGTPAAATVLSSEKDRVVFYMPDHTASEPRLIVVRRFPSAGGTKGVAQYSVTAVVSKLNADGTEKNGNINAAFTLRVPDGYLANSTEISLSVTNLIGFLINSSLMTPLKTQGVIPYA